MSSNTSNTTNTISSVDENKIILIHIPKTAGTSVKYILNDYNTKFKELHLNSILECQPIKHIDRILKNEDIIVILTWRNPVKHIESSFHFYKEYAKFNYPKDINEFINSKKLHNQQSSFLLKHNLFDMIDLDENKVSVILKLIDRKNTFCFLQDDFDASKKQMLSFLNIGYDNNLTNKTYSKRFNFNKPIVSPLTEYQIQKIHNFNKIDFMVYNLIVDKYNYVQRNDVVLNYIPWQYPINLIAGIKTIKKYEIVLKTINQVLYNENQYDVKTYVEKWIDIFSNQENIIFLDGSSVDDKLSHIGNIFNDDSERIVIPTRF